MGDSVRHLLAAQEWQGVGVLVTLTIAALTWLQARRSHQNDIRKTIPPLSARDGGAPPRLTPVSPTVVSRLVGALLVLIISYTLFAAIWAVLAFVLNFAPTMVFLSSFAMFAAPPGFLALVMRWPFVGGFLGGAVPMSLFALYHAPEFIRNSPTSPPPLAWFVVFFLFGGMLGALTAGPTVIAAHSLRVPLPRNYRRPELVGA